VLKQRILTAVILLAALVGSLWWSPLAFAVLITLGFAIAQAEWLKLAGWRFGWALTFALLLGGLMVAALVFATAQVEAIISPLAVISTMVWLVLGAVVLRSGEHVPIKVAPAVSVVLALLLPLAAWCALMLFLREGATLLLSVLCIVWAADTAAYFAGRAFGRRKLAPHISPGKTWAGVWGAVATVIVIALAAWKFFPGAPLYTNRLLDGLGVALTLPMLALLVALSIVGDLFESLLKRQAGEKDSGHLLPGHGGLYDRLDAMLALLPPAALFWRVAS